MYHRRKLLLAMLEMFEGKLNATDCQKLMFLFCKQNQQDFYDFFPYKYGACSFVLHQDKIHLVQQGYLEDSDSFCLKKRGFLAQVEPSIQMSLNELKRKTQNLRGDDLLRKVYLDYPYYASRSLIASTILSDQDLSIIQKYTENTPTGCLYTIGYEGISIDLYLDKLIGNHIDVLIDVRKNPISRKYGFSKKQLAKYTASIDVEYLHIPELGIPSSMRQQLDTDEEYHKLFEIYSNNILPKQTHSLITITNMLDQRRRVALTCFEASHDYCHRSKIAEYYAMDEKFDFDIVHL